MRIVCDLNRLPHDQRPNCRDPRPPDKSVVPKLLRLAKDAEDRARRANEHAAYLRSVVAEIEDL